MTHIHKPSKSIEGGWKVLITENISPLSKVIETIHCTTREDAWRTYYWVRKKG